MLQELHALVLGHYVARAIILQAAHRAGVSPVDLPIAQTVRVIQMRLGSLPRSPREYGRWHESLLDEMAGLPRRRQNYPRVRKVVRCPWPSRGRTTSNTSRNPSHDS